MIAYARRFGVTSAILSAFMLALTAAVAAPARPEPAASAPESAAHADPVVGFRD
ncbi:MAG: hypothetical protein PVI23_02360 [Maricaulaceae bacterium]|jgi:hypothetical protein